MRRLYLLSLLFLMASPICAQNPQNGNISVLQSSGGFLRTFPVGTTVTFCAVGATGLPCTPALFTFTNCSPLVTVNCVDVNGNLNYTAMPPNNYQVTITGLSIANPESFALTVGIASLLSLSTPPTQCVNQLSTGITVAGNANCTSSPGGSYTFGPVALRSINSATVLADQLTPSSGFCGVTGSDASAKIQCAINLLPVNGGIVNALNLSDAGGTGSTIIDPGAKSVTLYLGPYTYFIQQVVLESNFHIIGTGMGNRSPSDTSTTVLQSCATCAAINAVVLGTNGGIGSAIQGVLMDGLRIYGATSDTAIGMNLKTVNGPGTGIWYSTFRNICVGVCGPSGASANGFSGGALILDATATGTINQFLDFYNVQAFKTNGGGFALGLLGTNGQMNFIQCEFDGPTRNDGTTVVQIVNSSGNGGPYTIVFTGATVQHGTLGVNIAGAANITFIGTHFETVGEAIQISTGVSGTGIGSSTNISFIQSTCQNFCGNLNGSGWWAKNLSPASGTKINFWANQIQSTVDASYIGFSNYAGFTSIGDEQSTTGAIAALQSVGMNIPIPVTFTTTAVASESVTVTGATASSHCWAEPTNSTAAALTGVFLSGQTTNAVTLNHSATSGGTFNIFCTPN